MNESGAGKSTAEGGRGARAGGGVLMLMLRNVPFVVVQVVAGCCLVADVVVLGHVEYAVTAVPIELFALLYLWGNNRVRGGGGGRGA